MRIFIRHYREDLHGDKSRDPLKIRPNWYSAERCIKSIINEVLDYKQRNISVTLFYDGPESEIRGDKVVASLIDKNYNFLTVLSIRGEGTSPLGNAGGKLLMEHIVTNKEISDEEVIYICENDYLHRAGFLGSAMSFFQGSDSQWCTQLANGGVVLYDNQDVAIGSYLSLNDNPDYYRLLHHQNMPRRIAERGGYLYRQERTCTGTFLAKKSTLKDDFGTWMWKDDDFDVFSRLSLKGRMLYVTTPSFSTHSMRGMDAPGIDWEEIANNVC